MVRSHLGEFARAMGQWIDDARRSHPGSLKGLTATMRNPSLEESVHGGAFIILIPLFNDWETFAKLAVRLDEVLAADARVADILIVDDASTSAPDERTAFGNYRALRRVDVLSLRRNLGH